MTSLLKSLSDFFRSKPKFKVGDVVIRCQPKHMEEWEKPDDRTREIIAVGKKKYLYRVNFDSGYGYEHDCPFWLIDDYYELHNA